MKLYLMRHGDSSLTARTDNERSLSAKGIEDITHLAKLASSFNIEVSNVWHSGKLRAQQTAEIISQAIHSKNGIQAIENLEPTSSLIPILDKIYSLDENVFLVGHMPFMGRLASKLIVGDEDKDIVAFNTGSLVCLERVTLSQWVIAWMVTPPS